jgi:hypothetical protein
MVRASWLFACPPLVAASIFACGGPELSSEGARAPTSGESLTSVEIAELEIAGSSGVDRFTSCPPAGELGQDWIPKVPPWAPPAAKLAASPALGADAPPSVPDGRTPTERAVFETYADFRRCYQRGLLHDPTQDGHAAIVLRVGPDGRVAAVESYGVCELSSEVVACMKANAGKLRFDPHTAGSGTITIPAVFTPRGGRMHEHPTSNDAYTAAAYITLEQARPELHTCDEAARRAGQELQATASFHLDLDAEGRVLHTHVDDWRGNQDLLACAAHVLERLAFDKPPAGRGRVLARIGFNPRAGSK